MQTKQISAHTQLSAQQAGSECFQLSISGLSWRSREMEGAVTAGLMFDVIFVIFSCRQSRTVLCVEAFVWTSCHTIKTVCAFCMASICKVFPSVSTWVEQFSRHESSTVLQCVIFVYSHGSCHAGFLSPFHCHPLSVSLPLTGLKTVRVSDLSLFLQPLRVHSGLWEADTPQLSGLWKRLIWHSCTHDCSQVVNQTWRHVCVFTGICSVSFHLLSVGFDLRQSARTVIIISTFIWASSFRLQVSTGVIWLLDICQQRFRAAGKTVLTFTHKHLLSVSCTHRFSSFHQQ